MSGSSVTVPGVSGSTLSLSFVGSANVGLANQIANALAAASHGSTLDIVAYTGGPIPVAPAGTTVEELLLSPTLSGSVSVPAGASGIADVLIVANTQPITIHGNANLSIVGGGPGPLDIIDPNFIAVGASIGATGTAAVTVTAADSPYQVAMGPGFESVTGLGTGTIGGGVGNNFINVEAEAGANLVNLIGTGDTVLAGSGTFSTSVNAGGYQGQVDGEGAPLIVADQGYLDTISAGASNVATVTAGGFRASVVGGSGTLTYVDSGLRNTIQAGVGAANVTLDGSVGVARGGTGATGSFTVLDQTASNTIIGATSTVVGVTAGAMFVTVAASGSNTDVFGRKGNVSVLDQATGVEVGGGGGTGVVTVDGANALIYGGPGTLNVSINAANAIVGTGSAAATINAAGASATGAELFAGYSNTAALDGSVVFNTGANSVLVGTGGSNTTVNAGAGFAGVYIGTGTIAGSNVINGTTGSLYVQFVGGAGSATVFGGEGQTTLFGTDGTNANFQGKAGEGAGFLYANGSPGGAGSETLSGAGSATNDTLDAAVGNVSLVAGSGNDELLAGVNTGSVSGGSVVGGDALVGGTGSDTFDFTNGTFKGGAVISSFTALDTVNLVNYNSLAGGNQASIALGSASVAGGNTTIALADGTHITFTDTTVAQLTGHLFSS